MAHFTFCIFSWLRFSHDFWNSSAPASLSLHDLSLSLSAITDTNFIACLPKKLTRSQLSHIVHRAWLQNYWSRDAHPWHLSGDTASSGTTMTPRTQTRCLYFFEMPCHCVVILKVAALLWFFARRRDASTFSRCRATCAMILRVVGSGTTTIPRSHSYAMSCHCAMILRVMALLWLRSRRRNSTTLSRCRATCAPNGVSLHKIRQIVQVSEASSGQRCKYFTPSARWASTRTCKFSYTA